MKKLILIFLAFNLIFTQDTEFVKYEEEGTTAILTIHRPSALNALNSQVLSEIDKLLFHIDTRKIRAVIITGAGDKSFVAGADIAEMSTLNKKQAEEFSKEGNRIFKKIEEFPVPVIAAINGFALGGGCEISLSCDIRICSENAIFGQPEVGLGITPGFGGTQRLSRLIGMGRAKQIIFTGQNIDANEAYRIGLVNGIYPQNELLNEAKKKAELIAKNGPFAVKSAKFSMNQGIQYNLYRGLEIEERNFGECFGNQEQKERMENFLNKTKKKKNLREVPKISKTEEKKTEITEKPKKELKPTETYSKPMKLLTKDLTIPAMPAILTSGDKNNYNSMTIAWGSIGVGFARPIFTVYVKPDRYTYEFIDKSEIFTVSYIDKDLFGKFGVYGSKSGRDINKEEASGANIKFLDDGGITFEEAEEVYVCRIIAKSHLQENDVHQDIIEMYKESPQVYPTTKPHTVYFGEIIGHYKRE